MWRGVTSSVAIEEDGTRVPNWNPHLRGAEDTWCVEWRGLGGTDDELLDKVACILRDEGLIGLSQLHRLHFQIEPGLAEQIGVIPWIDSGAPPGQRWAHLATVEHALRETEAEERRQAEATPHLTFDDIAHLPGSEPGPLYGLTPVESERLTNRGPLSDAQAAKLIEWSRKNIENSNRRRRRTDRRRPARGRRVDGRARLVWCVLVV